MQRLMNCMFVAAVATCLTGNQALGNFANPGFESPITSDGPPFIGSWEGFAGGGTASSANSNVMPRTGAMGVNLSLSTPNSFAGVFQDIPNLVPGFPVTFNGWHKTTSSPLNLGVEVRIEWRNSVSDTEVGRTPNSTPVPASQYAPFSLTAVVPAGANTARAVYAIQSFSTNPLGSGTVFLDDFSFGVPEPTGLALMGLGMGWIAIGARRRQAQKL